VTTWLHRVVVNACLDRIRASRSRAADPLPDDLEERAGRGALVSSTDAADDPEARTLAGERRRAVLEALATLPVDQRAALVLVDMEGYSVAETAAILECAEGTIKSRCSRGRARLAPLLGALRPGSPPPEDGNPPPATDVPSTGAPRGPPGGGH
jgi:RNA polymerase sigma-70 factor, ECF subfamily